MKGSQRSGARALASHLLNARENECVELHELRGFVAADLTGALLEAEAIATYTKCQQPFFHVSINPPTDAPLTPEQCRHGVALIEDQYPALKDQPRALVFHVKHGRHHAHVVWSRINADTLKAVNLPYFKLRLRSAAKELARACGLSLPKGLEKAADRDPLNYDHGTGQQCRRLATDPKALKAFLRTACAESATGQALAEVLATQGLILARGDRRGFVAVHEGSGEVLSLSRYAGVSAKDLKVKYRDPQTLPTVAAVRKKLAALPEDEAQGDATTRLQEAGRIPKKSKAPRRGKRQRFPERQTERYARLSRPDRRAERLVQRKRPRSQGPSVTIPDQPANDRDISADAPLAVVKAVLSFDPG